MCLKIKQKFGMEVHYIVENNKAKMNEKGRDNFQFHP